MSKLVMTFKMTVDQGEHKALCGIDFDQATAERLVDQLTAMFTSR